MNQNFPSDEENFFMPTPMIIDFGRGFIKYHSIVPSDSNTDHHEKEPVVSVDPQGEGIKFATSCTITRNVMATSAALRNPDQPPVYCIDIDLRKSNRYSKIHHPLNKEGLVKDWNIMEKMIDCLSYDIRVCLEESKIVMSAGPHVNDSERINMMSVMFERLGVPCFGMVLDAGLVAIGSDKMFGTVLDCGFGSTRAISVFDGLPLMESLTEMRVGGQELTMYFLKLLEESGLYTINGSYVGDREYFGPYCKEKHGYIPLDFEQEMKKKNVTFNENLLDLRCVPLNNSIFKCTQALFQPSLLGFDDDPSIHEIIMQSISKCENDKQGILSEVIPCGGTSEFKGFFERLDKELKIISENSSFVPKLSKLEHRTKLALIGGSIVSNSTSLSDRFCVSMEEYQEFGESIVKRKV